jgi:hypothetical protein
MQGIGQARAFLYDLPMALSRPLTIEASDDEAESSDHGPAAFRAFWAKFTVATAKRAMDPLRSSVLNAIGPALREEIRSYATLEWQPARVFVGLCSAIARDEELAIRFWRHSLRQSIAQPLIRTLVDGGISLFGRSPVALYRRTPRAYSLVSRECGELSFRETVQPATIVLRLADVPLAYRQRGLLLMLAGGFRGQADFCMCEADVQIHDEAFVSHGAAEFIVRW